MYHATGQQRKNPRQYQSIKIKGFHRSLMRFYIPPAYRPHGLNQKIKGNQAEQMNQTERAKLAYIIDKKAADGDYSYQSDP